MTQTLTMLLARDNILNSNDRTHWAKKAHIASQLRAEAGWLAKRHKLQPMGRVSVLMRVTYPDRSRTRDAHNLAPTLKPILDGIVDAGVLTGDDDSIVTSTRIEGDDAHTSGYPRTYKLTIHLLGAE